ncbi:hypothetical protein Acr_16g0000430 [Actinidia rufa]|uniref:At2g24240-like C-terminal beta-propeller domain-containing protein n=1 Tax=Actinidia rufa TaxID=165716 RepID=A0A7J0FXJ9_9ERIC|nr:hypothetical protein Acr_16g0000430 [Actinidia rufa]
MLEVRSLEPQQQHLANAGRNSFFSSTFDENWNLQTDDSGEYLELGSYIFPLTSVKSSSKEKASLPRPVCQLGPIGRQQTLVFAVYTRPSSWLRNSHPCETERFQLTHEEGIGVWDQATGKQISFYYGTDRFGGAYRLHYLPSTNCLMAASLFPSDKRCTITIEDSIPDKIDRDALAIEQTKPMCGEWFSGCRVLRL